MTALPPWTAYVTLFAPLAAAILAAVVAFKFGSIQAAIAKQQAATAATAVQTARNKLKFDLFDRRMKVYSSIYDYINTVVYQTQFQPQQHAEYLGRVNTIGWLFGREVVDYAFGPLHQRMFDLADISQEVEAIEPSDPRRFALLTRRTALQVELQQEHNTLARLFEPYLKLEH